MMSRARPHPPRNPPRHIHRDRVSQLLVAHAVLRAINRGPTIWKPLQPLALHWRQLPNNGLLRRAPRWKRYFPRLYDERFRPPAEIAAVRPERSDSLSVIRELTWSEAEKATGSVLARFIARYRIPFAAICESQYFGGTSFSSTSDNEDSLAPLGNTEVAAIKKSPRDLLTTPPFAHFTEESCEIVPSIACEQSLDILDKGELRLEPSDDAHRFEEEARALAFEAFTPARDREVLAWKPTADDFDFAMPLQLLDGDLRDVAVDDRLRESRTQNRLRLRIPLNAPRNLEPRVLEGFVETADARE